MTVKANPYFIAELMGAAKTGVLVGANIVRNEMIDLITNTPKTGVLYRRNGVTRRRSAPGQPFASDTGNTLNQIQQPEVNIDGLRVTATIVVSGVNAKRMEFGTEKMEPRPFAKPALDNKRAEAEAAITTELKKIFDAHD